MSDLQRRLDKVAAQTEFEEILEEKSKAKKQGEETVKEVDKKIHADPRLKTHYDAILESIEGCDCQTEEDVIQELIKSIKENGEVLQHYKILRRALP